ncbi:hypothetical protein FACS1894216_15200 [Synergistales bacterium]|nr:hypothetical protein FACS1894216_15200 [Synergistales bacterium]
MNQTDTIDCFACGKKQISKNEIGLNKKMLGREIKQFYCLDCFAEYLEVTTEELLAKIEDFKLQGCALFK